ncbi:DNA primase [Candidatus Sumerlaeota bacterium]|nr:DNA primase [Candidatus Sumerlaeota bacterium]
MSSTFSTFSDFANRVRTAADIVEVVGEYVELKRAGANLKGLCPFHQEKTPSFNVHPAKQIFKCFGCGKGGDVIAFVREIERADFREALEILAGKYGLEMPRFEPRGVEEEKIRHRQNLGEALAEAARYYAERLAHPDHGVAGREYLDRRGVSREVVQAFNLGLASEDSRGLTDRLRAKGFSDRTMLEAGLAREFKTGSGVGDYLRGRLIFPILGVRGTIVGFGGRVIGEGTPKYLNTPETELFRKGHELYGLSQARDTLTRQGSPAVLVEGYMDVIACHQAGVTGAVASMGTALTADQSRLIRRYTREAVFLYDGDEAGIKAILRGLEALVGAGLSVRVGLLPEGEDPDSYARREGVQALRQLVSQAVPFLDFLLQQARRRYDMNSPEGTFQALELFEPVLEAMNEELVREGYITRLALELGHPEAALRRHLDKKSRSARRRAPVAADGPQVGGTNLAPSGSWQEEAVGEGGRRPTPREMGLLRILIEHGDARSQIRPRLRGEWIEHPMVRRWVENVLGVDAREANVWPHLMAQCRSPEQEGFLQSVVFESDEPGEDYLAMAEQLVDRIEADYRLAENRRLNAQVDRLWKTSRAKPEIDPIAQRQMENLQERVRLANEVKRVARTHPGLGNDY